MGTYPLLQRSASSALPQGGRPAHPRPCLLELFYRRLDVRDVGVPVLACHTARGPEQEQNRRGALCRQVDGRRDGDGGKKPGPVWVKEIRGGWPGSAAARSGRDARLRSVSSTSVRRFVWGSTSLPVILCLSCWFRDISIPVTDNRISPRKR